MKILSVAFLSCLLLAGFARADIAVVVTVDSPLRTVSQNDLINVFMGRYRRLPTGETALPVDLSPLKARFYRALVDKDLAEINSYWARLIFSGQASPPLQMQESDEMLQYIRRNPGALGYLDAAAVPDDVRIVLQLSERQAP
ncbi:type 2 periplasmic-binding domain-containing protein [Pseudomonas saliphila]|uniref:hypothetical protein n=1 Tax=Pseudomonas saliphila TaxID=2586906 RepID=UPI00123923DC|nr:hypothetical protein [Pseudomonas saliphila]